MKKKSGIYLTGGWGYGNKGDNAIFEGMMQTFNDNDEIEDLIVTSYSPKETLHHHGMHAIDSIHGLLKIRRPMSWFRWISIFIWRLSKYKIMLSPALSNHIKKISESKAVVFGGGGYFNDEWPDMLRAKYFEMEVAAHHKTPTMIYGQTIGPFTDQTISKSLAPVLKRIDKIAYRDVQSKKILDKAQVPAEKCVLTADEANLLTHRSWEMPAALSKCQLVVGVMIQALRPHLGAHGPSEIGSIKNTESYIKTTVDALTQAWENNKGIGYIFIPSTTWDEAICKKVYSSLNMNPNITCQFLTNPDAKDFIGACQNVDIMVSTNMHPIILAATSNIPSIALSYHYKVDDYMASLGLDKFLLKIDDFTSNKLSQLIIELIEKRNEICVTLAQRHSSIRDNAKLNWKNLKLIIN